MFNTISFNDLTASIGTTTSQLSGLWIPVALLCGVFLTFMIIEFLVDLLRKPRENIEVTPRD